MADDLEEFTQWRDSVEVRVSTLEETVGTEKRLRAGMDADMSDLKVEFRAQGRLLKALAVTQSEHTATLAKHTATLAEHTATLEDHTARLTRLEAGQAKLEAGQAKVLVGVETIIGLLDRDLAGLAETVPETVPETGPEL